ncbi:MAG: SUMF1/EgtB/PvdO family nonheme iron enzyme [Minicystis sp.]
MTSMASPSSRSCDRVLRGGSFRNTNPRNLRSANRNRNSPENRNDNIGFRCARGLSPQHAAPGHPRWPQTPHAGLAGAFGPFPSPPVLVGLGRASGRALFSSGLGRCAPSLRARSSA